VALQCKYPSVGVITKGGTAIGGASRIAVEFDREWRQRAGESVLFVYRPTPEGRDAKTLAPRGMARLLCHLDWRLEKLGLVRRLAWEEAMLKRSGVLDCDVLHFHDVFECTSPRLLQKLSLLRPVILTVHDCSPFTGGCLYPVDCRRFEKTCGRCPQREKLGRFDFTSINVKLRRQAATCGNTHFIFPSRWIQSEAEKSLPIQGRSHVIPNGFNPEPYMFPTRHEARKLLGLPAKDMVVLMGAHSLGNPYKGASFALHALRSVADLDPLVMVLGHPSPEVENALKGMRTIAAGFVSEKPRLANYYAAADLLLFPSLADNLPIMIQESMAAGTPVLAFNTGGIPEMIEHDKTGWLVEKSNQDAFNVALRSILIEGVSAEMGLAARNAIQRQFPMSEFIERHLELYRKVLESR
jgi:glycosyltransferase involved in cell wall biosynthesis